MNLHKIVRGAIKAVARDIDCSLFVSTGESQKDDRGIPTPTFYKFDVACQFQSMNPDSIQFTDNIEKTSITRKIYLYANSDLRTRPWAGYRPLSRVGDYIQDKSMQFWRVDAVLEDFSHEGWVCVQGSLITTPKQLVVVPWSDTQ